MPTLKAALVLGARGMLARSLIETLEAGRELSPVAPDEKDCDITRPASLREAIKLHQPQVVFNCAAFTDVDGCERDPDHARSVNADGVRNVAEACNESRVLLVHVGTDFIFDGKGERPYREDDAPNPLSVYGMTKLEGERHVAARAGRHLIVRTAWTFGPGREHFVNKILARARSGGALSVVTDQVGSPTYTRDLAEGMIDLVRAGATGTYHVVNSGSCSRHEFARAIVEEARLDGVTIESLSSPVRPGAAPRPAMSVLDTLAFRSVTGRDLRPWREALRDYLQTEERMGT